MCLQFRDAQKCTTGGYGPLFAMPAKKSVIYQSFLDRYQVSLLATASQGHSRCFQPQSCQVCQQQYAKASQTCDGQNKSPRLAESLCT